MTPPSDDEEIILPPSEDEGDGDQGDGQSGRGKAGDGDGATGAARANASPAFFQLMSKMGATMEQITQILKNWMHLKGSELRNSVADFAREIARASAQPQVNFDGDYGIVTHFLTSQRPQTPTAAPKAPSHDDSRPGPR